MFRMFLFGCLMDTLTLVQGCSSGPLDARNPGFSRVLGNHV